MNNNFYVIVMAGGIGSRFWPFSRTDFPKQFHDILGVGKTMIQQTVERFEEVCPKENIYIVTNESYKEITKEQLPFLTEDQILCEPVGRNTAPCVAYAAWKIQSRNPNACLLVAPSDHIITNERNFASLAIESLNHVQDNDVLVTMGINPSRPDTGYGYIQYLKNNEENPFKKVKTFTEKPSKDWAIKFLESGDFVWNAGIFIWSANSIITAFRKHLEPIAQIFDRGANMYYTSYEDAFVQEAYSQCTNISIDYGIMEKADNVFVILADFGWSDLGTWKSLYDVNKTKDQYNNLVDAKAVIYDTKNCIIKSSDKKRLLVVNGLDGYIVAQHKNVTMICKMEDEQKVKDFVSDLKLNKGQEFI